MQEYETRSKHDSHDHRLTFCLLCFKNEFKEMEAKLVSALATCSKFLVHEHKRRIELLSKNHIRF